MWDMTTAMDLHNVRCQLMLSSGATSVVEKGATTSGNSSQSSSSSGVASASTAASNISNSAIALQHMNRQYMGILQVFLN